MVEIYDAQGSLLNKCLSSSEMFMSSTSLAFVSQTVNLSHLHGQKLKRLAFVSGNFNGGMTAKNINERINTVVTVSKRIYNSGSSNDYSQL